MNNPGLTEPTSQRLRPLQRYDDNDESSDKTAKDDEGECVLSTSTDGTLEVQRTCDNYPLSKNDIGWRRIIRNFSPSWFSVTMGTGICSTILMTIPWRADWLYYLAIIFFVLNVILFSAALTASILRYLLWPEIWPLMLQDPYNSLFLGTIPMGFATLVQMWILVCVPAWGRWAVYVAWGFWMIDAIAAVSVMLFLSILLMSASPHHSLQTITAVQLLPIAATIVAVATGSKVAEVLPEPQYALGTVIICYVLWGMSVPMAVAVLIIYFQRLALHKIPSREVIVSAFIPLGPLGFGGFGVLHLGRVCRDLFPKTHTIDPLAGQFAYVAGFFIALILWGWGLAWFAFALAAIYKSRPFPFNMGWWGFTFPLGVYSLSTILIGEELPSLFFRVLGAVFGTAVILLWVVNAVRTAQGAWDGKLFHAPCLALLRKEAPPWDLAGDAAEKQIAADRSNNSTEQSVARNGRVDRRLPQRLTQEDSRSSS